MEDIQLPTNMTANVSNLVGPVLVSYTGTASGVSDLSGWTLVGAEAGSTVKLDAGLKQVYIQSQPWILRTPSGKVLINRGKVSVHR